jgi:hypothetical protein
MLVKIEAQIRQDKRPFTFSSTCVKLEIPDDLLPRHKEEMLEAGRRLAWMRLWKFVENTY